MVKHRYFAVDHYHYETGPAQKNQHHMICIVNAMNYLLRKDPGNGGC